jgi:hypothetical protein
VETFPPIQAAQWTRWKNNDSSLLTSIK